MTNLVIDNQLSFLPSSLHLPLLPRHPYNIGANCHQLQTLKACFCDHQHAFFFSAVANHGQRSQAKPQGSFGVRDGRIGGDYKKGAFFNSLFSLPLLIEAPIGIDSRPVLL